MDKFILETISNNMSLFSTIGYYVIFLLSFFESVPVIGFIVPGQTLIVIGGFLAKKGLFSYLIVFILASLGAVCGDIFAYYMGKKYGESFLKKHGSKFFVKESLINRTKVLLNEHPGKALFLGRMNSVTRSLAPFLAGVSGMNTSAFLFFCTLGGILSSLIFVSIGYIFGSGFEIVAPIIGKYIFGTTFFGLLMIWLLSYMKGKGFRLSKYQINIFIISILSLIVFATMSEGVAKNSRILNNFDHKIEITLLKMHTPILDNFFLFLGKINNFEFMIGFIVLVLIVVVKKKHKDDLIVSALYALNGYLIVFFSKLIFQRPRPTGAMYLESGFSYPSGHAVLSTLFFLFIIHHFRNHFKNELKSRLFVTLNALLIFLFCFSRVYLGVHYATDIIAGIAVGIWIFTMTILASQLAPWLYKKIKKEEIILNL